MLRISEPHPAGACSEAQILEFEASIEMNLPAAYKAFVMATNGGSADSRVQFIANGKPTATNLDIVYGFGQPYWADIHNAFKTFSRRVPEGTIPIARDSGGNLFILDCATEQVFFWDHEAEDEGFSQMPRLGHFSEFIEACVDRLE